MKTADHWARIVRHSPLALLLDYDGTLVPFAPEPELAAPDAALKRLAAAISALPGLRCVLVSGRSRADLERWFGDTPGLWLAAEHGAFLRGGGAWISPGSGDDAGVTALQATLESLASVAEGAQVERKSCSVAFHYRRLAPGRRIELLVEVDAAIRAWLAGNAGYEKIAGAEVIEVRPASARKSAAVEWVRRVHGADLRVVAIGDDVTDEDMFAPLESDDEAIVVARSLDRVTRAGWRLDGPTRVRRFLRWMQDTRARVPHPGPPVIPHRVRSKPPSGTHRGRQALALISNRLPDLGAPVDPSESRRRRVGGLVAALKPVVEARSGTWFGWSGRVQPDEELGPLEVTTDTRSQLAWFDLPAGAYEAYYNGFCNRTLWPLLHTLPERIRFAESEWNAYFAVNDRIAEAVAREVRPDCAVWVHDFHLFLVAAGFRRRGHTGPTGFFLHVPFPGVDVFRLCPWAGQLLDGLMRFDLIGFQTDHDARNFLQTVAAMSPASISDDAVEYAGRSTRVLVAPIGIVPEAFEPPTDADPDNHEEATTLLQSLAGRRLILGVDRLDYTKGIPERLEAFARLLASYPHWRGQVSLVQVCVPSRADVPEYQEQRQRIESAVGRVNGEFGEADWTPVRYLYRSYGRSELMRLYRQADVCLVTPLRDGMNLIAKEYVAAQETERPGVLVLSQFAGAASELVDAVLTNPWHPEGMAADIDQALCMDPAERRRRHARLLAAVHRSNATSWAESFVSALDACRRSEQVGSA